MDNRPTPPQPISYDVSLTPTARAAAIASVIAETIFTIYYLVSAYPAPLVAIQIAASLLGAFGLVLLRRSSATRIAAQVLTGALYISVIGLALFTGGLLSSASPWLVFVPIMATVILGAQGGLFWGGVSLLSAVGLYLFRGLLLAWTLHPTQDIDRLMDLSFAVLSGTAAVYVNELIKSRAMKELDEAKAQLTRLANLDPLTNIYNRRHFITRFPSCCSISTTSKKSTTSTDTKSATRPWSAWSRSAPQFYAKPISSRGSAGRSLSRCSRIPPRKQPSRSPSVYALPWKARHCRPRPAICASPSASG